jgi:uncharacterized membrane protein
VSALLWTVVIGYIIFRLIGLRNLTQRLDQLTEKVATLESRLIEKKEAEANEAAAAAEKAAQDPSVHPLLAPFLEPTPKPRPPASREAVSESQAKKKTLLDFENLFGGKIFVWIGGCALALGSLFLVQYAIENNYLPNSYRIALGAFFGAGLIALAHRIKPRFPLIRESLAGAGVLAVYAAIFAGTVLYHFWSPMMGLLMMSAMTALTIGFAINVGKRVAYIGLVGGYLTPLILGTADTNTLALFSYLLLLGFGLGEIGLRKAWPSLAVLGACGGSLWLIGYIATNYNPDELWILCLFLIVSTIWQVAVVARLALTSSVIRFRYTNLIFIASLLAAVLLCIKSNYNLMSLNCSFLMLAGFVFFQRLRNMGRRSLLITSFGAFFIFLFWPAALVANTYAIFGLGLIMLYGITSWRSLPAWPWSLASTFLAISGFLIAYGKWADRTHDLFPTILPITVYSNTIWSVCALILAAYFTFFTKLTLRRFEGNWWQAEEAIGFFVTAAVTFTALAFAIQFFDQVLVLAWATQIGALIFFSKRFTLPALRHCAVALSFVLLGYLAWDCIDGDFQDTDLKGSFLSYALPAAVMALGASRLKNMQPLWHQSFYELATPFLILLWVYVASRQFVAMAFPADPANASWSNGILITCALWLSLICIRLSETSYRQILGRVGKGIAYFTLFILGLSYVLFINPLYTHIAIGAPPVVNALFFIYGIPAALLAFMARSLALDAEKKGRFIFYCYALVLLFIYSMAAVRQIFSGTYLDGVAIVSLELYTYSAVLIVLAFIMLVAGIVKDSKTLRVGSLVFMSIGALKVFLWDMDGLQGLWRVIAFMGLGVSLVAIGYLYQRFGFLLDRSKIAKISDIN